MSIAVSAVIGPSRLFRATILAYAALNLGIGLALASGALGAFACPPALAACCVLAACACALALTHGLNPRRIDISGLGEIRLTVQQELGRAVPQTGPRQDEAPWGLLPGSTVWPQLMLLLLWREGGAVTALMVLPDSVSPGQFRALAVAVRNIAGRDNKFFGTNQIL